MCTSRLDDLDGTLICAKTNYTLPIIYVTPHGLHNPQCGCLEATLMHEALHLAGRTDEQHNKNGGFDDVKKCLKCGE